MFLCEEGCAGRVDGGDPVLQVSLAGGLNTERAGGEGSDLELFLHTSVSPKWQPGLGCVKSPNTSTS